jgi:hypothetical protein
MGAVNGRQGELDFDGVLPGKAFPAGGTVPREKPQKTEPAVKTAEGFHFEPPVDGGIADYSQFPANRMYIAAGKNILAAERPQWVPPFDYQFIERSCHIPPVRKIGEQYFITSGRTDPACYKMSLDGFAATVDYYIKYGKALNKQKSDEKNNRLIQEAKDKFNDKENPPAPGSFDYRYYKAVLDGTNKVKPAPIRLLSIRSMTHSQAAFFRENNIGKREMWNAWRDIRTSLEQKMMDMSCQYDDFESSYGKGVETSYGDKNTSKALFEELGVLVKRQNGDAINREEIGEIRDAFNKIKPVFGSLKIICAGYGLKVSHSGVRRMHARKFAGIFFDVYRAIGVKFGDTVNNHLVLAHELSHFLDSQAGKATEHFFSSDRPGSKENGIAALFRTKMNQQEKRTKNSKYLQRTCECFARAMEQFTAFAVSPDKYLYYCGHEAYAPDTAFRETILPCIAELLQERQTLWHQEEPGMKNTPEAFEALELQAERETAGYHPAPDIAGMKDTVLDEMVRITCGRRDWYQKTIDAYKKTERLSGGVLEALKMIRKIDVFGGALETEYRERIKHPETGLFPVYPGDITAEHFKEQFLMVMKSPKYTKQPLQAAGMLAGNALYHNRDAIGELLKSSGCVNADAMRKVLRSWMKAENKPERTKKQTEPSAGMVS